MNNKNKKKNIDELILEKIKGVEVTPKWKFAIKNMAIWFFGISTVVAGGLSLAATIFVFRNVRYELYEATHENLLTFFVEFIPVLWIFSLCAFVAITYYSFRNTENGYKQRFSIIILGTVLLTFMLGFFLHIAGMGRFIDKDLGRRIPFHKDVEMRNMDIWAHPEKGLLVGLVSFEGEKIVLKGADGIDRELLIEDISEKEIEVIEDNLNVRVIGIDSEDGFYVCMIIPFEKMPPIERKINTKRSNNCKGVKPYMKLIKI